MHGICVYGNFDMGLTYMKHGAPLASVGRRSAGLRGLEERRQGFLFRRRCQRDEHFVPRLAGQAGDRRDLYAVFNLQTLFNPENGTNANGSGSIRENNGLAV